MNKLLRFEPWLVGALAVAAVAYEPTLPYAVIGAVLLQLPGWISRRSLKPSPLHLPLLFLLGMMAVSSWVTPLPGVTAQQSLRLLLGILLMLSLENGLDSRRWLGWAQMGALTLALLLATSGLLFVNWSDKFSFLPQLSKLLPRLASALDTAVNPNLEGGILAILLAGLLAWPLYRWKELRWPNRLGWTLTVVFIGAVLFLTQARTALIGLAAGIALLCILRWRRGWIPVTFGLAISLFIIFSIGPQRVWSSLTADTGGSISFNKREDIWLRARFVISDFPLTGVGMGTFGKVVDAVYPLAAQPVNIDHAHNLYMQIAIDLGLPGLLAWLGCWGVVLWSAWRLYRSQTRYWRMLGVAALSCQVALGISGLLDCVIWDTRPSVIVWGLWGLILAAHRVCNDEDLHLIYQQLEE